MKASSLVDQVLPCGELGIRTNYTKPDDRVGDSSLVSKCLDHLARIAELKQANRENELKTLQHSHARSLETYLAEYSNDLKESCEMLSAMAAHKTFIARRLQERLTRKDFIPIAEGQKRTFVKLVNDAKEMVESEAGWQQRLRSAQQVLAKTGRKELEEKLSQTQAAYAGVEQGLLLCEQLDALRTVLVQRSGELDAHREASQENSGCRQNIEGSTKMWEMPELGE